VSYDSSTSKILILDVTTNFTSNSGFTLRGVSFTNFNSISGPDNLYMIGTYAIAPEEALIVEVVVILLAPFGPSRLMIFPRRIWSSIPSAASVGAPPYLLAMAWASGMRSIGVSSMGMAR